MIGHGVPVYGGYASQYGHGLGNVLGGIVRAAIPVVKPLMKSAGKQLLLAGAHHIKRRLTKKLTVQKKRSPLHGTVKHKRKSPPGKRSVKKKTKRKPRDIFA